MPLTWPGMDLRGWPSSAVLAASISPHAGPIGGGWGPWPRRQGRRGGRCDQDQNKGESHQAGFITQGKHWAPLREKWKRSLASFQSIGELLIADAMYCTR